MINRTILAGLIFAVTAPCWAVQNDASAIGQAQTVVVGGPAASGVVFDGSSGGSSAIARATSGALKAGNLTVAEASKDSIRVAAVPAPRLGKDARGAKSKKGGFFSGRGIWFGLGGAAIGAGAGFLIGGPVGAIVGGLVGAVVGFSGKRLLMFGFGGAVVGAGAGFFIGGPVGAIVGAAAGAIVGFLLSKLLS